MFRLLPTILLAILPFMATPTVAAQRPNFLWIVSEDNSKHYLKLFDDQGAATPHIDRLAEQGLIFERAFSNAPVCSVARTTLATSVYAPRIGTQFHRQLKPVQLPPGWKLFQQYLHTAGYYTTNNSKTDYNVAVNPSRVWDESSKSATWKNRGDGQPFFHMESHGVSHESSLHFDRQVFQTLKTAADPNSISVWPYLPDTPLLRYTTARYHDRIAAVDDIVGQRVAALKQAGLFDDTFIFYFGDHGGVLPGSKGYAWERGLHVPLVVHVPKNFRHLLDEAMTPGERVQGFVEFVDFGPTLLHLAGVEVPPHMDGRPFLGPDVSLKELNQRDEAFGYADRFDEKYEQVRSLRKGRYKYLRFYQGYLPDGLQNNYRYRMLGYQQWRELQRAGKLNSRQAQFFQPKPAEALFDISSDPHELHNLAGDPNHAETLTALRKQLQQRVKSLPDLSMYPEDYLVEEAVQSPLKFAEAHKPEIARLVDVADLALLPAEEALPKLREALQSENRWVRYWAATSCAVLGEEANSLTQQAKPLLEDGEPAVRIRAAEFLGRIRAADPAPTIRDVLRTSKSHVTTLLALNAAVYLQDALGYELNLSRQDIPAAGGNVPRRIEYLIGGQ